MAPLASLRCGLAPHEFFLAAAQLRAAVDGAGVELPHLGQGLQTPHARHHLVQQDGVEGFFLHHGQGIQPVGDTLDLVALFTQVAQVAAQFIDVVVDPKNDVPILPLSY